MGWIVTGVTDSRKIALGWSTITSRISAQHEIRLQSPGVSTPMKLDPSDLARRFREHEDGLCGAILGVVGPSIDRGELLQEAFLRCLKALRAGKIQGDPTGFMYVVTLNLARDLRRRDLRAADRGRTTPIDEVPEMEMRSTDNEASACAEEREAVADARAAIRRLRDPEKEVFILRVSAGLTFERVAEQLGIPVGTAKTRMRLALGQLRQHLAAHAALPPAPSSAAPSAAENTIIQKRGTDR